jgi:hypothetical protein
MSSPSFPVAVAASASTCAFESAPETSLPAVGAKEEEPERLIMLEEAVRQAQLRLAKLKNRRDPVHPGLLAVQQDAVDCAKTDLDRARGLLCQKHK